MIDCTHRKGRRCLAGHYGGTPSDGVCGQCPHRTTEGTCPYCGAKWHAADKCPIGESTTVEAETRRAKSGGCCGAAK